MERTERHWNIDWTDRQQRYRLNGERFIRGAQIVFEQAQIERAELSLVLVDDPTMHELNRTHLAHDYPTDVLSFLLETPAPKHLEGEVIVSADTAAREAQRYGWRLEDELLLYVVHGCLHLVGHDDHEDREREVMRAAEARVLAEFGLKPRWNDEESC